MGTECVCAQVFSLCAMRVRFLPHGQVRRGAGLDEKELGVFWENIVRLSDVYPISVLIKKDNCFLVWST